jgi:ribonuclease-3
MPDDRQLAGGWAVTHLGYRFRDESLLERALTHRSAGAANNERLEFVGDAVLGLVTAELLFHGRPAAAEGPLTRLRARLVRKETLAGVARGLGLGAYVRLGSGELRTGGHQRDSILANALEAVIGAIFLDAGLDPARTVIHRLLGNLLDGLPDDQDLRDPKTRLQEHLQARGLPLPEYVVGSVAGAAHDQWFEVTCRLPADGRVFPGAGPSRRAAEQEAATAALAALVPGQVTADE